MRIERISLRTWLLGAFTLWALLVWILAISGMGGRIRTPVSDPSLIQPFPASIVPSARSLAGLDSTVDIAAHPLFSEDRRPQPFVLASEEKTTNVFDYVLTSVLIAPPLEMAILQSAQGDQSLRLKIGQSLPSAQDWRLVSVTARSAVFEGPEGERTLELRVHDGTAGGVAITDASPVAQASEPSMTPSTTSQPMQEKGLSGTAVVTADSSTQSQEAQMEAIRRRIEARRAQLNSGQDPARSIPTK